VTEDIWAIVEKRNKRLHIVNERTGGILYTPPDFVKIPDREALRCLAHCFNWRGRLHIDDIAEFEWDFSSRNRTKRRRT
jgi:hypothetical protein